MIQSWKNNARECTSEGAARFGWHCGGVARGEGARAWGERGRRIRGLSDGDL